MGNRLLLTRQVDQPQGVQVLYYMTLLKKLFNEFFALETLVCFECVSDDGTCYSMG